MITKCVCLSLFILTTVRKPCQRSRAGGRLWHSRCSLTLLGLELGQRPHPGHRKHAPFPESTAPAGKGQKIYDREKNKFLIMTEKDIHTRIY